MTPMRGIRCRGFAALLTGATVVVVGLAGCGTTIHSDGAEPVSEAWIRNVTGLRWVDYNPSEGNPDAGLAPNDESVVTDLELLSAAGFTGLITYGPPGAANLDAAEAAGFEAVIVGVWDPTRDEELRLAEAAATSPLVVGFCVGNEGLERGDYTLEDLEVAANRLRATGLPVTTTEMSEQYAAIPGLADFGDWVFPNVHPYHSRVVNPEAAVSWTEAEYDALAAGTDRFVMIKETGLPHDGGADLNEANQRDFYVALAETDVPFAYFEAFDGSWKSGGTAEPYWGLFHDDRTPTLLGALLTTYTPE